MKKAIVTVLISALFILGACGLVPDSSSKIDVEDIPEATETQEKEESIEEAVAGMKIVYGDNEAAAEEVPQAGEVILYQGLETYVRSLGGKDSFYYVKINPFFGLGDDFEHDGRQLEDWWSEPELTAYNEAYEVWLTDVYPTLDKEMKAAEARGEAQAQGWEKHNPQDYFNIYYEHTQTEDVISAWKTALEKAEAASDAYNAWLHSDEYYQQEYELLTSETERLKECGYIVELKGWDIFGYMTKEQLQGFDCGDYGYYICWAEKDEAADE